MSSADGSQHAWLGLLKWSLAYCDGTRPSSATTEMKKEDLEFLQKVMEEGIINEGDRMKSILREITDSIQSHLEVGEPEEKEEEFDEDELLDIFQELRDIVEQIDYARAFMSLGGIPFLLGIATYHASNAGKTIPVTIKKAALGTMATMAQNNPPVQLKLLELGHLPQLIQLFFDYSPGNDSGNEPDDSMREKCVQAISASIRGHAMGEICFCKNELGLLMLKIGIGMQSKNSSKPGAQLRKRCMFLLRALLTADEASDERHDLFRDAISFMCTHEVDDRFEEDSEIREISLATLTQLLRHPTAKKGSDIVLAHKIQLGSVGVPRIQAIGELDGEDKEFAELELDEWQQLMVALAGGCNA
ncbi:hypothetical protein THAOC_11955 [Thalassiosira oceanica]|uniref:Nucleotide exchange factor Fes1 domain-containing protein n=1 Tax=Thalassiosira oceanica TaxID=159749 RepID=K0T936_THAOC|nr:hypothetical protein THAOC_11955 [Thalassiosira oceanica]|eukprot:EJK67057.1 hypothetical protein THAOC_11955 [Thalassiosira oceanica]